MNIARRVFASGIARRTLACFIVAVASVMMTVFFARPELDLPVEQSRAARACRR
jgi:hypothetical protein